MKESVALLVCGDRRGTGYLVLPDCVLTCYHVIQPAVPDGWIRVVFPHGEYLGQVSLLDIDNDCAALRLSQPVLAAPPLRLGREPPRRGRPWQSYGFPAATLESGLLIDGDLQDEDGRNLRRQAALVLHSRNVTAGALMQGFSGSPVLADGVVIGQLQQIVPDETLGAHFGVVFATPARLLAPLLPQESHKTECPYRGLAAFQREDAGLFFGRDALIKRLGESYRAAFGERRGPRLLTILGPSGAGKSSLVRAGLLPALQRQPIPGPLPLRAVVLKPGEQPLDALTRALVQQAAGTPAPAPVPDIQAHRRLRQALRSPDERGHFDGLRLYADALPQISAQPLLILIDQFEELYTLCQDAAERDAFVSLLLDAASAPAPHVMLVLTLRSDYLGELQRYHPKLSQAIAERTVLLPAMNEDELRSAISEPAARAGRPLDEGTVELLLSQAQGGATTLPLLEFALTCIWEGLVRGKAAAITLKEIGGVGGALAARAQQMFDGLDDSEQRIARRVFLRLGQLNESSRGIRKRQPISELCGREESPAQVLAVLRRFACDQVRLISLGAEPHSGAAVAELTHESLLEHWALCRSWLAERREELRFHQRLTEAAQWWAQASRPDGRLWRPPDLELLRDFHARRGDDMTQGELDFCQASERHYADECAAKEAAERRLTTMYEQMRQQVLATYIEQGRQSLLGSQLHHAALWLHRAAQEGSRHPMLPYLLAQAIQPLDAVQTVLCGHADRVLDLCFHPDGKELATASRDGCLRQWELPSGRLKREHKYAAPARAAVYSHSGELLVAENVENPIRIWRRDSGQLQTLLTGHHRGTFLTTLSPDSAYLAAASEDYGLWVWAVSTGQQVCELRGHTDRIRSVAFSPDSRLLVTTSDDQTARIWDVAQGRSLHAPLVHPAAASKALFSPDCRLVATIGMDMTARVWRVKTGALLSVLHGHSGPLNNLRFSVDGNLLLTTSHDHTARLWQVGSARAVAELRGHHNSVVDAAFSPDGRHLITGSWDATARIWEADSGRPVSVLRGHTGPVVAVAFSPDAVHVGTASDDHTARVWSVAAANPVLHHWSLGATTAAVAFTPDGRHVAAASLNGVARVFDGATGQLRAHLEGHGAALMDLAVSPDGKCIATASRDRTAILWDLPSRRQLATLRGHRHWVTAVTFSADGAYLATASRDGTGCLWQATSGRLMATLRGHTAMVTRIAFDPGSTLIASASYDGRILLWRMPSGESLAVLSTQDQVINDLSFHPAGRVLASASDDGTARIWRTDQAPGSAALHVLSGHAGGVTSVRFSPSGELVATASRDDTARVWEAATGKLLAELTGHTGYVASVAFSPDSARIVTASRDGSARVWEARTGKVLAVLGGHEGLVSCAGFSPDGQTVLTGSIDQAVRLWRCHAEERSVDELAALLRHRLAYKWQHDVIVPSALEAGASGPPPRPPRESALLVEDGQRLLQLGAAAWVSGDAAAARASLQSARSHFLAMQAPASAAVAAWSQAAIGEAQKDPAADRCYAEAVALARQHDADPAELGATFIDCARIAHDQLLLPQAALRALALALSYSTDRTRVLIYQVEALIGAGQAAAALDAADSLLSSGQPYVGWRLVITCLAWVAASVLGERRQEQAWGQRALAEFKASFQLGDLGWSFLPLRRTLARQPHPDAALELLEVLDGGRNQETVDRLARLLQKLG